MDKFKLKDVTNLITCGVAKRPDYTDEGVMFLSSQNVKANRMILSKYNYISREDYNRLTKINKPEKGDILYTRVGSFGEATVIDIDDEFAVYVSLTLIKPKREILDSKYLMYYLNSPIIREFAKNNTRGIGVQNLNVDTVRKFEITLPHIDMQKKIVMVLEKAKKLIDNRKAQIEELDELIKSVFYDMFGDPSLNQRDWNKGKISDIILKTQYGTSSKADEKKGEYEILRMNNITYTGNWNFKSIKYIDLDEKDKEKYLVYKGEVLFNRTNSKELVGKTAVYKRDEPVAYAGYLIKMIPNDKANGTFIAAYMNTDYVKSILFNMAKNIVGMANINAEELKGIKVYIPPIELQNKYAEIVEDIDKQKKVLQQSLSKLEDNFNSLMQKAFKGELFNLK